nr:MAG TPA: hypothetical protein [Caudoviricetes sp.]
MCIYTYYLVNSVRVYLYYQSIVLIFVVKI